MEVCGVLLVFLLPYIAGYVLRELIKQRETSQIETYLIGFFFLFFAQGVIFSIGVFGNMNFSRIKSIMLCVQVMILILFFILAGIRFIPACRSYQKKQPWKREERFVFFVMLFVFFLVLIRILLQISSLREDAVLETVLTTLNTDTCYRYHPMTGQLLEAGMVASRKLVTLPLYDAYLCAITGIDAEVMLQAVLSAQTLLASYFAAILLISRIYQKNRKKIFAFALLYGLLILSGDYFHASVSYHLIHYGYAGSTICAAVLIPYLLYVIYRWYQEETAENEITLKKRITYGCKIVLCFGCSLFLTGAATGLLFLFITLILSAVCCMIAAIKGVKACK